MYLYNIIKIRSL